MFRVFKNRTTFIIFNIFLFDLDTNTCSTNNMVEYRSLIKVTAADLQCHVNNRLSFWKQQSVHLEVYTTPVEITDFISL